MKILVAEDERDLNKIICDKLRSEQYTVEACYDGVSALDYICMEGFDGAVFDVMLPKMNGFAVLQELRRRGNQTPVLFLTVRRDTRDVVRGLDLGASDYITKPFKFSELLARLRVMLRSRPEVNENIYRCGDIEVRTNDCSVWRGGKQINLTAREYALFLYLIRNKNIVLTRQQIESNIWDASSDITSNVVDVYIRFIRRKLNAGDCENVIHTVRGIGYILRCSSEKKDEQAESAEEQEG